MSVTLLYVHITTVTVPPTYDLPPLQKHCNNGEIGAPLLQYLLTSFFPQRFVSAPSGTREGT